MPETKVPSLNDFAGEADTLPEFAEFSPRYQAYRMYRTCLSLQSQNQYPRARRTFYDSLSWFGTMFDRVFVERCYDIVQKYSNEPYTSLYTYEQIEQLKFVRIVTEFTRLLLDASTRNRTKINTDPNRRVELVPVGYAQAISYEHWALEFYNRLSTIQKHNHPREVMKFFSHGLAWFGGIFDSTFIVQGYLLSQTESSPELKYRRLLLAFSKLLSRKGVTSNPFVTLSYKPNSTANVPKSVEEVVRARKVEKSKIEEDEPFKWQAEYIINSTF